MLTQAQMQEFMGDAAWQCSNPVAVTRNYITYYVINSRMDHSGRLVWAQLGTIQLDVDKQHFNMYYGSHFLGQKDSLVDAIRHMHIHTHIIRDLTHVGDGEAADNMRECRLYAESPFHED